MKLAAKCIKCADRPSRAGWAERAEPSKGCKSFLLSPPLVSEGRCGAARCSAAEVAAAAAPYLHTGSCAQTDVTLLNNSCTKWSTITPWERRSISFSDSRSHCPQRRATTTTDSIHHRCQHAPFDFFSHLNYSRKSFTAADFSLPTYCSRPFVLLIFKAALSTSCGLRLVIEPCGA